MSRGQSDSGQIRHLSAATVATAGLTAPRASATGTASKPGKPGRATDRTWLERLRALVLLNADRLDPEVVSSTLSLVLKYEGDIRKGRENVAALLN